MALIYIVEDDENILELISASVKSAGHKAECFSDGMSFLEELQKESPNLILLDIMLPELSGIDIIKRLKADTRTCSIPVMFLTAKGTEIEKVIGLELGAEDYVTKPFGVLELLARIKNILRRTNEKTQFLYKDLNIDFGSREIIKNNIKIKLTYKEFELLQYLYDNRGIVIDRERLLQAVWGIDFDGDTTRTIDMHIKSLRQKLGDSAENPQYIETVRGYGYKFIKN